MKPTMMPTEAPTESPTKSPTLAPTTLYPTKSPTSKPTAMPTTAEMLNNRVVELVAQMDVVSGKTNMSVAQTTQTLNILESVLESPAQLTATAQENIIDLAEASLEVLGKETELTEAATNQICSVLSSVLDASLFEEDVESSDVLQPPEQESTPEFIQRKRQKRKKAAKKVENLLASISKAILQDAKPGEPPRVLITKNFALSSGREKADRVNGPGSQLTQATRLHNSRRGGKKRRDLAEDTWLPDANMYGTGSMQTRRRLSEEDAAIDITAITYAKDIYAWSGEHTEGEILSVGITDSSSGLPEKVENLPVLFQFATSSTPRDATRIRDVRTEALCAYWDESTQSWEDRGVFTIGVGMTGNNTSLCASSHLTSFTSRAQWVPPNSDVLHRSPASISNYRGKKLVIPYFVAAYILFQAGRIWMASCKERSIHYKFTVEKNAMKNFIQYGELQPSLASLRGSTFMEHFRHRFYSSQPYVIDYVPTSELYCFSRSMRMLCSVVNVLVVMFVLVILMNPKEEEATQLEKPSEINWGNQIRRTFYLVAVAQLPNTLLPYLITTSRNIKSVTLPSSGIVTRLNSIAPSQGTKAVKAHWKWSMSTRISEFKAYVHVMYMSSRWSSWAVIAVLMIVCFECIIVILTFGSTLDDDKVMSWLAGVVMYLLFDALFAFPVLIYMVVIFERISTTCIKKRDTNSVVLAELPSDYVESACFQSCKFVARGQVPIPSWGIEE